MAVSRKLHGPAILLLLLLQIVSPIWGYKPKEVRTSSTWHDMEDTWDKVEGVMGDNQPKLVLEGGHVALAPLRHQDHKTRREVAPRRWINHKIWGEDGDFIIMKITDDDMYFTGYEDKHNKMSYLKGWGKLYSSEDRELEFSEQYKDLLAGLPGDGGHDKLTQLPLGKDAFRKAVSILANNDPDTTDQKVVALAFATVEVMICEALRFKKIRETLRANWESGTVVYLTMLQAESTVTWGRVSYCMLLYHRTGIWGKDSDGSYKGNCRHEDYVGEAISFEEANQTVNLVLRNIPQIVPFDEETVF